MREGSSGCPKGLRVLPLATPSLAVRQGSGEGLAGKCPLELASLLGPCRVLLSPEPKPRLAWAAKGCFHLPSWMLSSSFLSLPRVNCTSEMENMAWFNFLFWKMHRAQSGRVIFLVSSRSCVRQCSFHAPPSHVSRKRHHNWEVGGSAPIPPLRATTLHSQILTVRELTSGLTANSDVTASVPGSTSLALGWA